MLKKNCSEPYLDIREFGNEVQAIQWKSPELGLALQGDTDTNTIHTHLFVHDPEGREDRMLDGMKPWK